MGKLLKNPLMESSECTAFIHARVQVQAEEWIGREGISDFSFDE